MESQSKSPQKVFFCGTLPQKNLYVQEKNLKVQKIQNLLKKKKEKNKQRHKAVSSVSKFIFMLMLLENSRKLMEQNRKNFSDYKLEIICGSGSQFRVTTRFF